jgi:uncharacterized phage protein (TIGR02216 family)
VSKFPWGTIMQLGIGRLRLSPDHFWRSTLRELVIGCGLSGAHGQPPLRQTLEDMMRNFPDGE